ncbi:DNA-binding response regulator [Denitrobaculum tricleocarpae]|uniref:DNA-binding response regulator n=1 Tax=Denitrobaculum tricleocarpae TaxID=2591009 RepID=A0A545TMN7_9PROT|nr:response regulator [Denitrobaculum tricleocarpae]TQV78474.1 DNA-binding response regulator [Denitrobaculum tricleocarpae]
MKLPMHKDKPVILFVDDEAAVLSSLSRQLRHQRDRWCLEFESSPKTALQKAQELDIDVVVSDMQMPGMNGLELIAAMRRFSPEAAYIMLTGSSDLSTAVGAINDASVFRFYTKPCPAELLEEGIEAGLAARVTAQGPAEIQKTPETRETAEIRDSDLSDINNTIGMAALDHLSLSVIVVDPAARVLLTNKSGGALLSRSDGLSMSAGEICRASTTSESEKLHQLIQMAAADPQENEQGSFVVSLQRPSQKRAYSVLAIPIAAPGSEQAQESCNPLVALYVSDPENQPLPSAEAISRLFGLTRAEARIVHELVKGASMDEAAENAGVTVSTARTYLKQAFSKTDTKRQAELVKLVLTYPRLSS